MKKVATFLFVLAIAATAVAQQNFKNAKLETLSAAGGFDKTVQQLLTRQPQPAWIAYSVPAVDEDSFSCCFSSWSGDDGPRGTGCSMEGSSGGMNITNGRSDTFRGGDTMNVFLRVNAGQVENIRAFSCNCPINFGGMTVYWMNDVVPAQSVAYLAGIVERGSSGETKLAKRAADALAMHGDPSATAVLARFVEAGRPDWLRKHAAFWLGNSRGKDGLAVVLRAFRAEKDPDMRKHFVFPISQSDQPEAINELIEIAKNDNSSRVRSDALFWLAQKAGKKAVGAITDAIENDPETDVKKKAVFALSQLPKDEGVPLLIQVARTNKNPAVRKQAIFWLGQSNDDRALKFIEDVLTR